MDNPTLKEQIERMRFVIEKRSLYQRDPATLNYSKAILSSLKTLEEVGRIIEQPWCDRHIVHDISKVLFEE